MGKKRCLLLCFHVSGCGLRVCFKLVMIGTARF
jgi:hypothetical protein